jgi:hypothetical protein
VAVCSFQAQAVRRVYQEIEQMTIDLSETEESSWGQDNEKEEGASSQLSGFGEEDEDTGETGGKAKTIIMTNFFGYILSWIGGIVPQYFKDSLHKKQIIPIYLASADGPVKAYKFSIPALNEYLTNLLAESEQTENLVIGNGNKRMNKVQEKGLIKLCQYLMTDPFLNRFQIKNTAEVYVEAKPTLGWHTLTWVTGKADSLPDTPYDLFVDLGSSGKFKPEASNKNEGLGPKFMSVVKEFTGKYEFEQDEKGDEIIKAILQDNGKVWLGCTGPVDQRAILAQRYATWLRTRFGAEFPDAVKLWDFEVVDQAMESKLEAIASANFMQVQLNRHYAVFGMGGTTSQFTVMRWRRAIDDISLSVAGKTLAKSGGLSKYIAAINATTG